MLRFAIELHCEISHNDGVGVLNQVRAWWGGLRVRRTMVSRTVLCDDLGISQCDWLGDREVQERLAWDEVATVLAYKRDCFIVDQIRVALIDHKGQVRVDVSEEDAGYKVLISSLPLRLKGCLAPDEWFDKVAFPAFETKTTELYKNSARQ